MKRWVSILGDVFTAPRPPSGAGGPTFAKKTDRRLEGVHDSGTSFFGQVVTLAYDAARLQSIKGLVVHGFRYSVKAHVSRSNVGNMATMVVSLHETAFVPGPSGPTGVLGASGISVRMLFDVPGDGIDVTPMLVGIEDTFATPKVGSQSGSIKWLDVPAGWAWQTTAGMPRAYVIEDYTPKNWVQPAGSDPIKHYGIGTYSVERLAPAGAVLGLVRGASPDVLDDGDGGGAVGAIDGFFFLGAPYAVGYLEFTKLEYLVSEKPTWDATVPTSLTVGAPPELFELTAKYPVGSEPASGIKVRLSDATNCVSFQNSLGQWVHDAVLTTNSSGKIQCRIRGEKTGAASVRLRDGGNTVNMTYLFAPALKATATVSVVSVPAPPDPPDPPPDTPPPSDPDCTVYPAVPGSPYEPPQVIREDIIGWNSGAVSEATAETSADLQFTCEASSVGAVIGLTTQEEVTGPDGIAAGFYFTQDRYGQPQFQYIERGKAKGAPDGCAIDDAFRVTYVDGVVRYYYDGAKVRTTPMAIEGTLRAGAGLYKSGDALPTAGAAPSGFTEIAFGGKKSGLAVQFYEEDPLTALALLGAAQVDIIRFIDTPAYELIDEEYFEYMPQPFGDQVMHSVIPLMDGVTIDATPGEALRSMEYTGNAWRYEFADSAEWESLTNGFADPLVVISADGVYYLAYALIGGLG